jgi:hypothetical protein
MTKGWRRESEGTKSRNRGSDRSGWKMRGRARGKVDLLEMLQLLLCDVDSAGFYQQQVSLQDLRLWEDVKVLQDGLQRLATQGRGGEADDGDGDLEDDDPGGLHDEDVPNAVDGLCGHGLHVEKECLDPADSEDLQRKAIILKSFLQLRTVDFQETSHLIDLQAKAKHSFPRVDLWEDEGEDQEKKERSYQREKDEGRWPPGRNSIGGSSLQ